MDEVCSYLTSMLRDTLESEWHNVFDQPLAELISESAVSPTQLKDLQTLWWTRLEPHVQAWTKRQAGVVWRKKSAQADGLTQVLEHQSSPELSTATKKLQTALRQLILVQTLIDDQLSPQGNKAVREPLWLELAPHAERTPRCYEKGAAKRGLEVEDLVQDASAHFQQVITRFNPEDARRAMLSTWFDDVVDNLFAAAVRPRKSDAFKRGQGGDSEEQLSDELPTSLGEDYLTPCTCLKCQAWNATPPISVTRGGPTFPGVGLRPPDTGPDRQ